MSRLLSPPLRSFLTRPPCPPWLPPESVDHATRQFYRDLGVPLVNEKPSLLLHDLGVIRNSNADNLFLHHSNRILCNVSGSGKTRLLLEGLCQQWGFYFVIAQSARDLQAVIALMSRSSGWTKDIFMDANDDGVRSVDTRKRDRNQAIAENRISKAFLARWVVLSVFIDVALDLRSEGVPVQDSIKRDWVLFQILPTVLIDGVDPFSALIKQALSNVETTVLHSLRDGYSAQGVLRTFFTTHPFFYVIDEAQVAGEEYMGAFVDRSDTKARPVLRPILQYITNAAIIEPIRIIFSGTGFSLEVFQELVASGVAKGGPVFNVVHTTGDFSEENTQCHYMSRYLPRSFLDSDSGRHLMTRVYEWLRGRHRFSVHFLEALLTGSWHRDRPASPHKLLNAYVLQMANVTPTDGQEMFLRGEQDVRSFDFDTFQWDKVKRESNMMEELAYSIYSFIMRGEAAKWWPSQKRLVEYGLARFVCQRENPSRITIEERLPLMSIMHYFQSNNQTFAKHVLKLSQGTPWIALEEAVLLAMTRLLQNQRPLERIFEFYGQSQWVGRTAQIMARNSSGSFGEFSVDRLSSTFSFSAKRPEEVVWWLESGKEAWCISCADMGPDLMTRVQLDNGELLLLVFQVKCHLAGNTNTLDAGVLAHAIESITPSEFFRSLKDKHRNEPMQQEVERRIESMLGAIQQNYTILRVVAAFPRDANFKSPSKKVHVALKKDTSPLAKLSQVAFREALITCRDGQWFLDGLKTHHKRTREKLDEGSDGEAEDDRPNAKRRVVRWSV